MKNNFKEKLYELLKKDNRLWNAEEKIFNETLLKELIDKLDEKLIETLLSDIEARGKFFIKVKDVYVLKQNELKFFIDENKLDNSYTQYSNKIGLRVGNKLLSERNEVVLDWPFKDCVLEGGMTKEDQKRNEIFFNEILAQDEIDRLLDPKVFTNFKRFTAKEEEKITDFKRDKDGTIRENLIIKGNNLLALHSLKKEFQEKVKLVYIDPPYNTGGEANIFTYNNNFNHSTWLTFMRNRLEVAKTFLQKNGFIAIAIDHYELLYLGVLADEIFGRDNRIGIITVVHKPEGRNQEKFFGTSNEFMLVYAKDKDHACFNRVALSGELLETFNLQDSRGRYRLNPYINKNHGQGGVDTSTRQSRPSFWYPIYVSKNLNEITLKKQVGYYEVFPIDNSGQERTWRTKKETFLERLKDDLFTAQKIEDKIVIFEKYYENQVIKTHWVDKKYNATIYGTKLLEEIINRKDFSYPKSLFLIIDVLKLMTSENDIIMDFFAGSGTTGHATFELNKEDGGNRKFILIEQLDEHYKICKERNRKILYRENISDSFIQMELKKWNEGAIDKIQNAKTTENLLSIWKEMIEQYFLNYDVGIKKFNDNQEEFKELPLDKQKQILVEMLDMNQLYVNYSERADKKYNLSKEDIHLSEEFYK